MILGTSIETYIKLTVIVNHLLPENADFMTFLAKVRVKFKDMAHFGLFSPNIGYHATTVSMSANIFTDFYENF